MGSNNIGDEGAKAIAALISKMPSLKHLHVGVASSKVGVEGLEALAKAVSKIKDLENFGFKCYRNEIGAA